MTYEISSAGSSTSSAAAIQPWSEARETRRQLLRFLVVGCTCVLVDGLAYHGLSAVAGLPLDVAKGLSYLAGVVVGFVGNKFWTFESGRKSLSEPLTYLALYALTLLANIACNRLALIVLGTSYTMVAFLFATGVTTVLNFLGMRLITFRKGIQQRRDQLT